MEEKKNMRENDNVWSEADRLREELAVFKERLNRQTIISDRMLRESMHSKIMWMRNINLYISIAGVILMPLLAFVLICFTDISWGPVVLMSAMIVFEVVYNIVNTSGMRGLATGDLLATSRRMLRFKRNEKLQMMIEVPLILLWFGWVFYDSHTVFRLPTIIGGIGGLCISFVIFIKEMRCIDRIVRQIDEFTAQQPDDEA